MVLDKYQPRCELYRIHQSWLNGPPISSSESGGSFQPSTASWAANKLLSFEPDTEPASSARCTSINVPVKEANLLVMLIPPIDFKWHYFMAYLAHTVSYYFPQVNSSSLKSISIEDLALSCGISISIESTATRYHWVVLWSDQTFIEYADPIPCMYSIRFVLYSAVYSPFDSISMQSFHLYVFIDFRL